MRKSSVVLARNPYWRTSILQFKGYNDSWDRVVQRSIFFPSRTDFAARAVQQCSAIFYECRRLACALARGICFDRYASLSSDYFISLIKPRWREADDVVVCMCVCV